MLRIAHISDLHFSKITYHPSQFLSKRWLGNLNLLVFRKKTFDEKQLYLLIPIWQKLKIQYLFVSGDLSSTSLPDEFKKAQAFFKKVSSLGIQIFTVPGNHDQYTKKAFQEHLFYQFFTHQKPSISYPGKDLSLVKDHIETIPLQDPFWLIGIDSTRPTSLLSSRGFFSKTLEQNLKDLLQKLPSTAKIILLHHFPFSEQEPFRKKLVRGNVLKKLLQQDPRIVLYLHGHTHKTHIYDLRKKHLPIMASSGATTHKTFGCWNFLEINKQKIEIHPYQWSLKTNTWTEKPPSIFSL